MKAVELALGVEVQLADHLGLVAGAGELAGEGVRRIPRDVALHADHAVCLGRLAGEDGAPRRDARGALRVGAPEMRAARPEKVDVGCRENRVALNAKVVAAPLV